MEKFYHSIQDWHKFADEVADLLESYIKYGTIIDENDGIYVDEGDNVSLVRRIDAPDEADFHCIVGLLNMSEGYPEINYEAVQELTDKYIFVR